MVSRIIKAVPYNRISSIINPRITLLPKPILAIIDKEYINSYPKPLYLNKNLIPIAKYYPNFENLYNDSMQLSHYEGLKSQFDSTIINVYYRDISTMINPDNNMIFIRVWFHYIPDNKLIKIITIFDKTNSIYDCSETKLYWHKITQLQPGIMPHFDNIDKDIFIKKLQVI